MHLKMKKQMSFILNSQNKKQTQEEWKVRIRVNGKPVEFKIDTGADANVISYKLYRKLRKGKTPLRSSKINLTTYSGESLPVKGTCTFTCQHKSLEIKTEFLVVNLPEVKPVLGAATCVDMQLIKKVFMLQETDEHSNTQWVDKYQDVKGLGCLPGKHKIQINPDATPVVHAARKLPATFHKKLKTELERMERLNVIVKVDQPTSWVNSMVIVEKLDGSIRVCLDPKDLNRVVKRSHHQLPTTEETMTRLTDAQYFSCLDASQGFGSIALMKRVQTFAHLPPRMAVINTYFCRLVFHAPLSQSRVVKELFESIEGVESYLDDILVWGCTKAERDQRLRDVLQRATENNLKFNLKRCKFTTSTFSINCLKQE